MWSGVLTYGSNDTDTTRIGQVVEPFIATSNRDIDSLGLMFGGAYDFEFKSAYIRPGLELGLNRIDIGPVNERGAGGVNLVLQSLSETHTWARPTVEAGIERSLADNKRLRLYARAGVQHYFGDEFTEVRAGYEGVNVPVDPLTTQIELGQDWIQQLLGVDLLFPNEMTMQLQYRRETANRLEQN